MVLSLITLAATVPLIATSTLQIQDQAQRHNENGGNGGTTTHSSNGVQTTSVEEKTLKSHLTARTSRRMSEARRQMIDGKIVVLQGGKLYLMNDEETSRARAHPFAGYLLPYPNQPHDGFVSTINDMNMLNWIYIDPSTHEVKYDVRRETDKHLTGPMTIVNLTYNGEKRIAFEGWEGFLAVEEESDVWALYFDRDDDGLQSKVHGKKVTEVQLVRTVIDEPD